MAQCKHLNCSLTEFGTSTTMHYFESGELAFHDSDFDNYTGVLRFVCRDCGTDRIYDRRHKRCPKFILDLWDVATNTDGKELEREISS